MACWFRCRQALVKMSTITTMAASQLIIEKDELKEVKNELRQDRGRRIAQNVNKMATLEMANKDELGKGQQMDQITKILAHLEKANAAKCYAATLSAPYSGKIKLKGGHKYTPGIEDFIHHGVTHCRHFSVRLYKSKGFVGYPANFFDDIIKYCYESDKPEEMIGYVAIELPKGKPAPWPSSLVQLHGADFGWVSEEQLKANGVPATLKEEKVEYGDNRKVVHYTLQNKHKPEVEFRLRIWFLDGCAICYKQMDTFVVERKVG